MAAAGWRRSPPRLARRTRRSPVARRLPTRRPGGARFSAPASRASRTRRRSPKKVAANPPPPRGTPLSQLDAARLKQSYDQGFADSSYDFRWLCISAPGGANNLVRPDPPLALRQAGVMHGLQGKPARDIVISVADAHVSSLVLTGADVSAALECPRDPNGRVMRIDLVVHREDFPWPVPSREAVQPDPFVVGTSTEEWSLRWSSCP